MKSVFTIEGPVIFGKRRFATVELTRNTATSTVVWSVGGIDVTAEASDEFSKRCEALGMERELHLDKKNWSCRTVLCGGRRYGSLKYAPHEQAAALAETIRGIYTKAVIGLPTGDVLE